MTEDYKKSLLFLNIIKFISFPVESMPISFLKKAKYFAKKPDLALVFNRSAIGAYLKTNYFFPKRLTFSLFPFTQVQAKHHVSASCAPIFSCIMVNLDSYVQIFVVIPCYSL